MKENNLCKAWKNSVVLVCLKQHLMCEYNEKQGRNHWGCHAPSPSNVCRDPSHPKLSTKLLRHCGWNMQDRLVNATERIKLLRLTVAKSPIAVSGGLSSICPKTLDVATLDPPTFHQWLHLWWRDSLSRVDNNLVYNTCVYFVLTPRECWHTISNQWHESNHFIFLYSPWMSHESIWDPAIKWKFKNYLKYFSQ